MHKSILIGITGNIASGKSFVIKNLRKENYKIFIADDVVHNLYEKEEVQDKILELIPELKKLSFNQSIQAFFCTEQADFFMINREKLAKIIFNDEEKRIALERLIHPMVIKELKAFEVELDGSEIGFAEVPLLYEAKMENLFNYVILVSCDKNIRLERALKRGVTKDKFETIDKTQMNDEKKKQMADFVIDSGVSQKDIIEKIHNIIGIIHERNNT